MIKKILLATLLFPMLSFAVECTRIPVELHDAYAVTNDKDDESLDAYVTIKNRDFMPHTVEDVSSSVGSPRSVLVQMYARNSIDDNIMTSNAEQITIPPNGGMYMFRPEHTHITLSGYKMRPNPGDLIDLTIEFADGCSETIIDVPVQEPQGHDA